MQTNDVYRSREFKEITIKIVSPRKGDWLFESSTGIKGLWSGRYIESAFDLVSTDKQQESV